MGSPTAELMFVGEGPGEQEDRQGLPFVGRSGQLLDRLILEEMGLTRENVYIANTIKCRPPGNRDPMPDELESCWPYLEEQLELIDPKVVVTLGNFATKQLLGTTEAISRVRGRSYPYRSGYLVPTFHPSAALRGGGQVVAQMRADLVRAKEALHAARPTEAQPPRARFPRPGAVPARGAEGAGEAYEGEAFGGQAHGGQAAPAAPSGEPLSGEPPSGEPLPGEPFPGEPFPGEHGSRGADPLL
jgi:uracil-DNA glycosylase